ncbi:MAG TPA: hypothetical protein VF017_24275 [Thermoanaerobaculia bacterium]|nr:hypothetical protein [Thermoanaerobaculia bacterium]
MRSERTQEHRGPHSGSRVKVTTYAVRASRNQAARWSFWTDQAGFRSVGRWLEALAVKEVDWQEEERGVYDVPLSRLL